MKHTPSPPSIHSPSPSEENTALLELPTQLRRTSARAFIAEFTLAKVLLGAPTPTRSMSKNVLPTPPSSLRWIVKKVVDGGPRAAAILPVSYRLHPGASEQEVYVRSLEPLASIEAVYAVDFGEEESMWVVGSDNISDVLGDLWIAGRQVHVRPNNVFRPQMDPIPPFTIYAPILQLADPIFRPLDARFPSLRDADLENLRKALPDAMGIRIFQYGEIEVLVNKPPLDIMPRDQWPLSIGGLSYFVTLHLPTHTFPSAAHLTPYGAKVRTGAHQSGACLGVKIVGPDGETSITAVTHAFVSHPLPVSQNLAQKVMDAFVSVPRHLRSILMYFVPQALHDYISEIAPFPPTFPPVSDFPITSSSQWASNLEVPLLGVEAYSTCSQSRADIGVVSAIFDFPSSSRPYPVGYVHDLCLIRGPQLPDVIALPLLPRLESFVPYEQAFEMRDKALFTVTYPFVGDKNSQHMTGKTVDMTTRESLLVGAEAMFREGDTLLECVKHSILWRSRARYRITRTQDTPEGCLHSKSTSNDGDYLGYSGSVLCVGSDAASSTTTIPATAQVIAFQNFETRLPESFAADDSPLPSYLLTYKGGFRLPGYTYESRIVMPGTSISSTSEIVLQQNLSRKSELAMI
ncbi:hypothetical protein MVEN_01911100 [Mycena venus]|uniref:Uncharacterized protein n=1 Tax=Mycena venus TaxID=2733690 RepID=A0A8H6XGG2_9AGAR|nr:hypothetical protein MVEN_01911100 [Mycena venus]